EVQTCLRFTATSGAVRTVPRATSPDGCGGEPDTPGKPDLSVDVIVATPSTRRGRRHDRSDVFVRLVLLMTAGAAGARWSANPWYPAIEYAVGSGTPPNGPVLPESCQPGLLLRLARAGVLVAAPKG